MCLKTVEFSLVDYDKGVKDFIGYGYKKLSSFTLKSYKNSWHTATGNIHGYESSLKDVKVRANDNQYYRPGFHIFLNKEDAQRYGNTFDKVVKVAFRGIVTFGTNNAKGIPGPCVVTKFMKVLPNNKQD